MPRAAKTPPAVLPFPVDDGPGFTPLRTKALLIMVADGSSNTAIGLALGVGRGTVASKIKRLREAEKGRLFRRPAGVQVANPTPLGRTSPDQLKKHERKVASYLHLIDLKRAGHTAAATEFRVSQEGVPYLWSPSREIGSSLIGSPAAVVAGE